MKHGGNCWRIFLFLFSIVATTIFAIDVYNDQSIKDILFLIGWSVLIPVSLYLVVKGWNKP